MFPILLMFTLAVVIPFASILADMPGHLPRQLGYAAAALLAGLAVLRLVARLRRPSPVDGRPRPLRRDVVASLDWPRTLSAPEFEAYCTSFLRQQGWQVVPARTDASPGVYLEATAPAAQAPVRAVLLCENQGEDLSPAAVRMLAQSAAALDQARPVLLTTALLTPLAAQAAAENAVAVLRPADLPRLAERVAAVPAATRPLP